MSARGTPPVKDWPEIRAFRMILRAEARLMAVHKRYFEREYGLKAPEFDLIAALGNTSGLRMSDLASAMITSPANVTRVCELMEKRGFVKRERSKASDREVIARLTPAGEKFFSEHFVTVASYTRGLMQSALNARETGALADLLTKLCENLPRG